MRVYINTERSAICGLPSYGEPGKAYPVDGETLSRAFWQTWHDGISRKIPKGNLIATHTTGCGPEAGPGWYTLSVDHSNPKPCDVCVTSSTESVCS